MLYLDNAATCMRKPLCVYKSLFYNTLFNSANAGRGSHAPSLRALNGVMEAQETIARLFNIDNPMNIAFTQNATYALNMAILGPVGGGGPVVVTAMDPNSVLRPVFSLGDYSVVEADEYGYVKPSDVEKAVRENTRLIVCTHASNVCGTIEPIVSIGKIAKRHNALFLIDAAQTAGCVSIDAKKTGADFIAFSGHKGLMGPLGTGGLYVRDENTLSPVITGGTGSQSESMRHPTFMPDMLHPGTVNAPAVTALGKAADFVARHGVDAIGKREREMANDFCAELKNMNNVKVYGKYNRTGTAAFNIIGRGSEETAEKISDIITVRAGYHCAPLAHRALHTDKTGAVRVSFGFYNTDRDVKKAVDAVWRAAKDGLG
ncbi:MAG: aminotransferase class V-fold PLP-dependent enzyme [Firmicutes bacterium]|nr:aminotransferase class V-fold PLP-dependent enzyme [Bacillota bacterium]